MPEGNAVWSPDGDYLAYVQDQPDRREVFVGRTSRGPSSQGAVQRATWFSHDASPAWSPDGNCLAYISHQHTNFDREYLLVQELGGKTDSRTLFATPRKILEGWSIRGPLSWAGGEDVLLGQPVQDFVPVVDDAFLVGPTGPSAGSEAVAPSLLADPFTDLEEIEAPNARLNSQLVDSYRSLRDEVKRVTGLDFLAELSDMWRGIDAVVDGNNHSAYASWHKAGRAFDTLFDFRNNAGLPLMEVVRENIGGETYWRIFLKAARQDGSLGMPLKVHPWDLSGRARRQHPKDGGTWKPIPYGYYVDVSEIIRRGGWERISAIDRREFSWRWHFLAIEYWHHQRRDGLTWYQAMQQVYPLERLEELFDWQLLERQGEEPYSLFNNGVPRPVTGAVWRDIRP